MENFISSDGHAGSEGTALQSTSGWERESLEGNGTNDYDFSALPGGIRYENRGNFLSISEQGYWWSSTENNISLIYIRFLDIANPELFRTDYNKSHGLSVRCVMDDE